ncbi:MAG: TlpA family protein disulfide reductase [Ruminococcaceae bacterium]|nr:TlpA family protein disulfide reductase [Oscillospiraceae bacterium]
MNKKTKLAAACALAILAFVGVYLLYNSLSKNYAPPITPGVIEPDRTQPQTSAGDETVDYSAPDFTVVDKDGGEHTLSQYVGKPIVLNFWASWCPPCKAEMPHFEEAYKTYPDVQFMMINVTTGDDRAAAEEFIADSGYTFPVFYDIEGTASYIYSTGSLPTTFFIDSDGNLVTYAVGALSAGNLEECIGFITDSAPSS